MAESTGEQDRVNSDSSEATVPRQKLASTTNTTAMSASTSSQGLHGTKYPSAMDARGYVYHRYSGGVENPNSPQPLSFQMRCFDQFYEQFSVRWDASTARLLEFGGGPSIFPLISACPHFSEIVFADYTTSLVREVLAWKDKDPAANDWSDFFRYQVNHLEGKAGNAVVVEREELLRNKLTSFVHCDITKPKPIDEDLGKFDVLSTSLCLESVATTLEEYNQYLVRLANLIKLEGYIVLLTSIGMSWYVISSTEFKSLPVTIESTCTSLENAGFVVEMERYHPLEEYRKGVYGGDRSNCQGKAVFAARRVK